MNRRGLCVRLGAVFAMLLLSIGVAATMPGYAFAQQEPVTRVRFCHNPPGNPGKYNNLTTSVNAFFNSGHPNHEGDIVPPFTYLKQGEPIYFEGMNWTEENEAFWENNCGDVPPVELAVVVPDVIVTQASCENNNTPSVVGIAATGISYDISPAPVPGAVVTVTATLDTTVAEWGELGPEWTIDRDTATRTVTLGAAVDCRETALLKPAVFVDAACGVPPSLVPAENGSGVTYSIDGTVAPGNTVKVIATLSSETHKWGDITGWDPTENPNVLSRSYYISNPVCPTSTTAPTATTAPMSTTVPTSTVDPTATASPAGTSSPDPTATATTGVSELPKTGSGNGFDASMVVIVAASAGVAALVAAAFVDAHRERS